MTYKPDFLCIGMQKGGTRMLYDMMALDGRFWMPLVKEFHHFDRSPENNYARSARRLKLKRVFAKSERKFARANEKRVKRHLRPLDERDCEFLDRYEAYLDSGSSDTKYLELFSICPRDQVTGDITPAYTTLSPKQIARVKQTVPWARIVLVIRDPVARAWSHINMRLRRSIANDLGVERDKSQVLEEMYKRLEETDFLGTFTESPGFAKRSYPSQIYRTWASQYDSDTIKVILFDKLATDPYDVLGDIASFLDAKQRPNDSSIHKSITGQVSTTDQLDATDSLNRKASSLKLPLTDDYRRTLVRMFRDELHECRRLFGNRVIPWLERYNL